MISVPVAIVGTFAAMAVVGFSLNNISLFGLVLAIGIVVDDAIVVVENVDRWLEHGLPPREAARKAMTEVTGPIIAVALVLCAVFVPCAFISGITGRFFKQFAVTIAVSTVFSAINSLTLSPALAAILLGRRGPGPAGNGGHPLAGRAVPPDPDQNADPERHGGRSLPGGLSALLRPVSLVLDLFCRGFNATFARTTAAYAWSAGKLLRLNVVVLLMYAALLALTYGVFNQAPRGFVPQQDQGRVIASIQLPDAASLNRTQEVLAEAAKIAQGDPNDREHYPGVPGVAHTITTAGSSFAVGVNGSNFGSMFITLDPFDQRRSPELRDTVIMDRLSRAWSKKIKDAKVVVFGAPPVPGLSVAGGFKLIVEDPSGLGLTILETQTNDLVDKLAAAPGLTRVTTQFSSKTPQLFMDIDRPKTAALGVSFSDVNQTLGIYLGSLYVNSFNAFGRHWQVNAQAEGAYRQQVSDINLLEVRNNQGQMVPLGTLTSMRGIGGPIFVYRYNGRTASSITGSLKPGVSSGEVIHIVARTADETLLRSIRTEWTELMFMQIRDGDTTLAVFSLAVMCVFLALSALYESWALPLAVILVVPLCLLSSIAGVLASHGVVDIFVQIGLVVLVGLACKNSILIVEFARDLHAAGRPRYEATLEASRLRLRPILMTSFSFILGVVPLVIATGAGSEMRRSLGTAVFSGMIGVTFFGIFLTPVFFYVISGIGEMPMFSTPRMRRLGFALVVLLNVLLLGLPALLLILLGKAMRPPPPAATPPDDTPRAQGKP
jgi:multidrug efflux pump